MIEHEDVTTSVERKFTRLRIRLVTRHPKLVADVHQVLWVRAKSGAHVELSRDGTGHNVDERNDGRGIAIDQGEFGLELRLAGQHHVTRERSRETRGSRGGRYKSRGERMTFAIEQRHVRRLVIAHHERMPTTEPAGSDRHAAGGGRRLEATASGAEKREAADRDTRAAHHRSSTLA